MMMNDDDDDDEFSSVQFVCCEQVLTPLTLDAGCVMS